MGLKRAYLIIVLSFAWLIGCVFLGYIADSIRGGTAGQFPGIVIGALGCEIGLIIGISELTLAKGYSIWLAIVLGFFRLPWPLDCRAVAEPLGKFAVASIDGRRVGHLLTANHQ